MIKDFHVKLFIASAISLNVLVGFLYLATKFDNRLLLSTLGLIIVALIVPFTFTLFKFYKAKEGMKILVSNVIIIAYFILEILLDYVLRIPFRDIVSLHVVYIIVFYMALFSMLSIAFNKDRRMGYALLAAFTFLISCLIFLIIG